MRWPFSRGQALPLWHAQEAEESQRRAEAEAARAIHAEARATAENARAQQTAKFLTELLDHAAEEIVKGRNPEALKVALDHSQSLLANMDNDPVLQSSLLDHLATLYSAIGEWKSSLDLMQKRNGLLAKMRGPDNEEVRDAELTYLKRLADHGPRVTVPPLLEELTERLEKHGERGGKYWFDVQRERTRVWLKLDDARKALACADEAMAEAEVQKLSGKRMINVMLNRVSALEACHDFAAAEALLDQARHRAERSSNVADSLDQIRMRQLYLLETKRDYARGADLLREQLGSAKARKDTTPRSLIDIMDRLVVFETRAGQHDQAIRHGEEALALARETATSTGGESDTYRDAIAECLHRLSDAESAAGRHEQAIRHALEGRMNAEELGNRNALLTAIRRQAEAERDAGHLEEAYRFYEECHQLRQASNADYRNRVSVLEEMRAIRLKQDRPAEALELSRQMWPTASDDPAAKSDVEHLGNVARYCLAAWKALKKTEP